MALHLAARGKGGIGPEHFSFNIISYHPRHAQSNIEQSRGSDPGPRGALSIAHFQSIMNSSISSVCNNTMQHPGSLHNTAVDWSENMQRDKTQLKAAVLIEGYRIQVGKMPCMRRAMHKPMQPSHMAAIAGCCRASELLQK